MAAKRKALSLILLVLAILAAPAAVAHVRPNHALHPEAIDFRYELTEPSGSEPFAVFTDPKLHLFDDVDGVELPRPSISTRLEQRISTIELATTQTTTHVFTHRVSEKLASGLRESLNRAIVNQLSDLRPKTRWGHDYVRNRWYSPETGTFPSPDPLGYVDSANLYAFAGGDPVNGRDPTGEYDPAAVHRWFQRQAAAAKTYYSSSDSVIVDAAGNTLSDIGSGFSSVFDIGTKTGETYMEQGGFRDGYATGMILSAGAGDAGETILTAVGTVATVYKTAQTVRQVKTLARISADLKVARTAEETGELLTERAMVRRGWEVGEDVKIRGNAGNGNGNQGVDKVFERKNVISADRTASVEVKSVNRPNLRTDRLGIQQGSEEFNRTRLARAANPQVSNQATITAAQKYEQVRRAGKLESYKATYDRVKGSVKLSKLISDPATAGRTILEEVTTWLLR